MIDVRDPDSVRQDYAAAASAAARSPPDPGEQGTHAVLSGTQA